MLLCLTANHQNASFDVLERLSIGAPTAAAALVSGSDFVSGAVVLATCNRFEAYLEIDEPLTAASALAVQTTVDAMADASGIDATALRDTVRVLSGDDVAKHLFAVTSGLESVVVGEDEISGQVRRALDRAREDRTTSTGLEQLFQRATRTSRGVKNQTSLGGAGRSLVRLALELASSRVTDWAATRVLIVGTGQYAATTVVALRDRGALDLRVFSPSGRAAPFATRHALTLESDLADAISAADIIITCTAALAIAATDFRDENRRLVIDLGLPRNVEPAVAHLTGPELLDLETISLHAPLEELSAHDDARAIVGNAAAEFAAEQSIAPAVVALRSHIFDLLDAEIGRAKARGDESAQTEAALRHLVGVLLHTPSVRARELAIEGEGARFAAAIETLYGIRVAAASAPAASSLHTAVPATGTACA